MFPFTLTIALSKHGMWHLANKSTKVKDLVRMRWLEVYFGSSLILWLGALNKTMDPHDDIVGLRLGNYDTHIDRFQNHCLCLSGLLSWLIWNKCLDWNETARTWKDRRFWPLSFGTSGWPNEMLRSPQWMRSETRSALFGGLSSSWNSSLRFDARDPATAVLRTMITTAVPKYS